jgi:hypothetical protein
MGLFANLANLFALLMRTKTRIAANRLYLTAITFLDLPALVDRRLGDTGLLPTGLLAHGSCSGSPGNWNRPRWRCGARDCANNDAAESKSARCCSLGGLKFFMETCDLLNPILSEKLLSSAMR